VIRAKPQQVLINNGKSSLLEADPQFFFCGDKMYP